MTEPNGNIEGTGDALVNGQQEGKTPDEQKGRTVLSVILWVTGSIVGVVLVLLVLFVLAIQTNWGAGRFGDFILGIANPFDDAITEYDAIEGNFINRVELHNLDMFRIVEGDTLVIAHVDTLRIRYHILKLLSGKVHLTEIFADDPFIVARQEPDGGWDLLRAFETDTTAAQEEPLFTFEIDELRVVDGAFDGFYYPPDADSVLQVRDLNLFAENMDLGENRVIPIDTLHGRFSPVNLSDWITVGAGGGLEGNRISIRELRMSSSRSDVRAWGVLDLPGDEEEEFNDVDFTLRADPLAFDDFRSFLPQLDAGGSVNLDVVLGGTASRLSIDGAAVFSDGGNVSVEGVVGLTDRPVVYDLAGQIRAFDPGVLTGNTELDSRLNVNFDVDLQGVILEAVNGEVEVEVFDSRYGEYVVERATLESVFEDGLARVNLDAAAQGAILTLSGTARPFETNPDYRFQGRVANLNIGRFLRDSEMTSDIAATFFVQGTGLDPDVSRIEGELSMLRSTINREVVENAYLELALVDGVVQLDTRVLFPEGRFLGTGTIELDDPISYRIRSGQFENVDLAAILGTDAASNFTGTYALTGQGTDPRLIEATAELNIVDSFYGGVQIQSVDLRTTLGGGLLRATSEANLDGGYLNFAVAARPFIDSPTLHFTEAQFRSINVGELTDNPDLQTDLTGYVELAVQGFDPERMDLQAELRLTQARINQQAIENANIDVDLDRGNLDYRMQVDLPDGVFSLVGTADPFQDVPVYRVQSGVFRNINVASMANNPNLPRDLTGTFVLDGRGVDLETMFLQAQLDVTQARINEQRIQSASLTTDFQGGNVDFIARFVLPEGQTQLIGAANFTGEVPVYTVREGTFENINVGALTGNPDLITELTGNFEVSGSGFEPEVMNVQGRLDLAEGRVNQQRVESAFVTGTLADGNLTYEARLDLPQGQTRLAGTAQPFLDVPTYNVSEGTFSGLNLGAFLGYQDWNTNLAGNLTLTGRGADPETMNLDARLEFDRSVIDQALLINGLLEGEVENGLVQFQTNLNFEEGNAVIDFQGRPFTEPLTYDVNGRIVNLDLAEILPSDTLGGYVSGRFDLQGAGTAPETMTLAGTVQVDTARIENETVSRLLARFRYEEGFLLLDTLTLESSFADIVGAGELAVYDTLRATDFNFVADIETLEPVIPYLPVERLDVENGQLAGRVFGPPGRLRFDVTAGLERLVYQDYQLANFNGVLVGELGPERELEIGEFRGDIGFVSVPNVPVEATEFEVTYQADQATLTSTFDLGEQRDARIVARVDLTPGVQRGYIEELTIRLPGGTWELLQEATITYGDEYRVSGFLLYSGNQQIAVDGVVDPDSLQSIVMTLENVRVRDFADLAGYEDLGGVINGSLLMTGPAFAPMIDGGLYYDIVTRQERVGDLAIDLRYDSLRLNIDGLLTHRDGSTLTLNGFLPLDLSFASADTAGMMRGVQFQTVRPEATSEVNLEIAADSFSIDWIDPFLIREVIQEVGGELTGNARITGTFDNPVLEGELRLINGSIYLTELEILYHDITVNARLEESAILIERANLRSGEGTAVGEGTIELPELTLGELNIHANLDDFLAADNAQYRIVADGSIRLQGTTSEPVVTGDITVENADIYLIESTISPEIEVVELTERDLRLLEERFGYEVTRFDTATVTFFDAANLELTIQMQRNTWLRQRQSPEMAIELTGNLDVNKEPFSDMQIFGTIEVIPERSYIAQFGRRFTITTGEIAFNGMVESAVMDIAAEYRVPSRQGAGPEAVILINLEGNLDNPEFTLGSEPEMDNTDIISYIATGQPAGATFRNTGGVLLGEGASLAAAQLTGLIEGVAAAELGLDVVEIQHNGLRGAELVAGKYLSQGVFVYIQQPVSFTSTSKVPGEVNHATQVTLEYQVIDWLLLRLLSRGASFGLNLIWEYAY